MSEKETTDFSKELSGSTRMDSHLQKLYSEVCKGFDEQNGRVSEINEFWDIYNCKLTNKQGYRSKTKAFVPICRAALDARQTRFVNQLFPSNGRYVDVVSESGDIPYGTLALLEHYVRKLKLRTEIVPALVLNGDIEGQYNLYVGGKKVTRRLTKKVMKPVEVDGIAMPDVGENEDIEEEEIEEWQPEVEVLRDQDVLVLPHTVDSVEDAIASGGSVTVRRRFSKARLKEMAKEGLLKKDAVGKIEKSMNSVGKSSSYGDDTSKRLARYAGVKGDDKGKHVEIYETWSNLKVGGELRLCVTWFGGDNNVLGSKVNPYWCDKCPVVSAPVEKQTGVFKGASKVKPVATLQYAANDAMNEAMDSSRRSLLPPILTDPEKNPRTNSMILDDGAIWFADPNSTQVMQFPQLWGPAAEIVGYLKSEIFQILSVNPAMIPGQTSSKKLSQAEVANEQQVDILTTADVVVNIEQAILNDMLERLFEYDQQFRDTEVYVRKYGELGVTLGMEKVEPIQWGERYFFLWHGVDSAKNAQAIQQQISAVNVVRGIPPELYKGHTLDLTPAIENLMENAFGPRLAPRVFKSQKSDMGVSPILENSMMAQGFDVPVHALDNDEEHLHTHMELMQAGGDAAVSAQVKFHMMQHQEQMKMKEQIKFMHHMQEQQGTPGAPGGMGKGLPGEPAAPMPGSVAQGPANMKQFNGAIHHDQLQDPSVMPRKM